LRRCCKADHEGNDARFLAGKSLIVQFDRMELTLPKPLDERISARDAALHLAIGLFVSEEATLGQAASTAGLSQSDFLRELGRRGIGMHYGENELAEDLQMVDALSAGS
jgi:predicted HTH domain antitoxin